MNSVILLRAELGLAAFFRAFADFIRSGGAVDPVDVLLMPVGAVLGLELFPTNSASKQVSRVQSLMLLESNVRFESLITVVTLECLVGMDSQVVIEVAGGFESLATFWTLKVSSLRILMNSNLVFPYVGSCDGSVATIGAEMRLRSTAVMGKEVLAKMTPTFVGF